MTQTLFLAWQDPQRRRWYRIGRLRSTQRRFIFVYTQGALEAQVEAGFSALSAFPELRGVYTSEELFALFSNRLLRPSRPEYKQYLEWLSVPESQADPIAILARSGGQRVTDTLEVFPCPERLPTGEYELHFLIHGLSHMPEGSATRAEDLKVGERLLLMRDFQNPKDKATLALRTSESYLGDMFLVGYCPRYLTGDIVKLMEEEGNTPTVLVERVNPVPAPIQFRILCKVLMKWSDTFHPFSGTEYQPIVRAEVEESSESSYPHCPLGVAAQGASGRWS